MLTAPPMIAAEFKRFRTRHGRLEMDRIGKSKVLDLGMKKVMVRAGADQGRSSGLGRTVPQARNRLDQNVNTFEESKFAEEDQDR